MFRDSHSRDSRPVTVRKSRCRDFREARMDDLAEAITILICVAIWHKQELALLVFMWLYISFMWAAVLLNRRKL